MEMSLYGKSTCEAGKSGVGMRLGKSGVGMVCGRVRHETIAYTKVSALKQLPCEHRLSYFKWLPK